MCNDYTTRFELIQALYNNKARSVCVCFRTRKGWKQRKEEKIMKKEPRKLCKRRTFMI